MRILLDVMGGDHAPVELVKGAVQAKMERPEEEFILIGDEEQIRMVAGEEGIGLTDFRIVHTPVVMTMEDDPMSVTRAKADSSMSVGLRMLAAGEGDVLVSTGNTGALFAGATLIVRKQSGVKRPAIATVLPLKKPVLLLDSGANINVTAEDLEQFAVMGSAYMKKVFGQESPRVGLLNNGVEEIKGTELQLQAYDLLKNCPQIQFIGNVEANRVTEGECDVLVTDGFTGNILLKSIEGMGKMMLRTMKELFYENTRTKISALLIREKLEQIKHDFDPSEYGGAPLLGIRAPVIKAHGSSRAKAYRSAILQAISYVGSGVSEETADEIDALRTRKKEEKQSKEQTEGRTEHP